MIITGQQDIQGRTIRIYNPYKVVGAETVHITFADTEEMISNIFRVEIDIRTYDVKAKLHYESYTGNDQWEPGCVETDNVEIGTPDKIDAVKVIGDARLN